MTDLLHRTWAAAVALTDSPLILIGIAFIAGAVLYAAACEDARRRHRRDPRTP